MNPLFLDSTKPVGDKVVTNVELSNLIVQPGEALFFELTDEFGFVQRFQMKLLETKKSIKMVAEVWLKYQHKYQYRFLFVKEGQQITSSKMKNISAGHVVSEFWSDEIIELETNKKNEIRNQQFDHSQNDKELSLVETIEAEPNKKSRKKSTRKLFESQLFDQIKLLIDDLND